MEKNQASKFLPWLFVAVLFVVVAFQYLNKDEPDNESELKYKAENVRLKKEEQKKIEKIAELTSERDSAVASVRTEIIINKKIIHEKHDQSRNDFRLLPRSKRIEQFAKYYKRR